MLWSLTKPEGALGNREYFFNRPYGIGGRKDAIP
jgi:hypothetical protein